MVYVNLFKSIIYFSSCFFITYKTKPDFYKHCLFWHYYVGKITNSFDFVHRRSEYVFNNKNYHIKTEHKQSRLYSYNMHSTLLHIVRIGQIYTIPYIGAWLWSLPLGVIYNINSEDIWSKKK